jgi:hypothetical protein
MSGTLGPGSMASEKGAKAPSRRLVRQMQKMQMTAEKSKRNQFANSLDTVKFNFRIALTILTP